MLDRLLEYYQEEEILIADGFDEAIIGIEDTSMRLIYSIEKCIDILIAEGLTEEDASRITDANAQQLFGTI